MFKLGGRRELHGLNLETVFKLVQEYRYRSMGILGNFQALSTSRLGAWGTGEALLPGIEFTA